MRFATVCAVLVSANLLPSQEPAPTLKLSVGTPMSVVAAAFGKPFGPFALAAGDDNAMVGAPTGRWDVYHLKAPSDRMYVTMVHFGMRPSAESDSAKAVDALMVTPRGTTTVLQLLKDQPAFASACNTTCEVVLVKNRAGNRSLLLRPKNGERKTVLYFEGDSAVAKWASVTSVDSVVSWAYALSRSQFQEHRKSTDEQVIATWSPETGQMK